MNDPDTGDGAGSMKDSDTVDQTEARFELPGRPRILAPVDLSAATEVSGQYAVEMARAVEAELLFLYVIPENPLAATRFFPPSLSETETRLSEAEESEARASTESFLATLPLEGLGWQVLIEKGVPYRRILETVERLAPRFVVQGTHGLSGLEAMVIGATAERVIRKTSCPVISVKPKGFGSFLDKIVEGMGIFEDGQAERRRQKEVYSFPPRRILYPTDFSEASRLAMEPALYLAQRTGAEIIVLHVTDREANETEAGARDQMDNLLKQMCAYHTELRIRPLLVTSGSTSAILTAARDEEADLLAIGTHGDAGWKTILTGSTAHHLLRHAPCPVITVKPNWKLEEVEKKFQKIFRKLSAAELQQISSENKALFSEELLGRPEELKETSLFLNFYTREGFLKALEEYGILALLKSKGLEGIHVVFDLSDPYRHRARVYSDGREEPEHLLVDLIAREGVLQSPRTAGSGQGPQQSVVLVLMIEWLLMQNPAAAFTPARPPLPGQDHPGLGLGYEAHEFLVLTGKRLRKDAVVNHPQYYHNAKLYHEMFKFYDPVQEGRLISLIRDTGDAFLADVSWAVYHGCLVDATTEEVVLWEGGEMICPLSEKIGRYFHSTSYQDVVWDTVANTRYRIDWARYRQCLESDAGKGTLPAGA